MKRARPLFLIPSLLCLCAILLSGCASGPRMGTYQVKIELDPVLAGSSIQLDLIGANGMSDLPKWESYSVSKYWDPGDPMRRDADKAVLTFGQGKPLVQTFANTDPIWSRWLRTGTLYLVVLVDLPGVAADRAGNADTRRLILPLDVRQWPKKVTTLELRVQESGVRLLTPMKTRR